MTSSGSPYARFRRALATGNLAMVRAAAAELPVVGLDDALAVCALMADAEPAKFDPGGAAVARPVLPRAARGDAGRRRRGGRRTGPAAVRADDRAG